MKPARRRNKIERGRETAEIERRTDPVVATFVHVIPEEVVQRLIRFATDRRIGLEEEDVLCGCQLLPKQHGQRQSAITSWPER